MVNQQPETSETISVAILTANRNVLLKQLLHQIERQLGPQDEVIVLDTAPSASTAKLVYTFNQTQFHYNPYAAQPFDYAAGRNELVRLASKDIVAFIDDDAIPFPHWLDRVRQNLLHFDVVGGPSVAAGSLPVHWEPELNWCIGLSPSGVVLRDPGDYPNTGNLAVRTAFARKLPFQQLKVAPAGEPIGREDAQWWMECRLRGDNVGLDYKQAVAHAVHPDRLSKRYLKHRAWRDGFAEATRDASIDKSRAAAVDFGRAILNAFSASRNTQHSRMRGHIQASIFSNGTLSQTDAMQHILKGALLQLRLNIGDALWPVVRKFSSRSLRTKSLKSIYVSADCLLGDTILLRRHIETLAGNFSNTEIIVTAAYPDLLTALSPNITVLSQSLSGSQLLDRADDIGLAIVPYFHSGNDSLWRRQFASRTITFDSDVGFKHRRNYHLAATRLQKDLDLHEHENLARLFRFAPLQQTPLPSPAIVPDDVQEWWLKKRAALDINGSYVVIHLGAGYKSKEWPIDYWTQFLQQFLTIHNHPVVIIGGAEKQNEGDSLADNLKNAGAVYNLAGQTTTPQLCAVIARAVFFIGACSGPGHIAMMYDVPSYILYAASEPYRWGATENYQLHAYTWALKQKLTAPELLGRPVDFRARLIQPGDIVACASHHFQNVMLLEKKQLSSGSRVV